MENQKKPYKYTVVGKSKVNIIQVFGSTTLVEYVKTGVQSSVHSSLVKTRTAKPYVKKTEIEKPIQKPQKKDSNNQQSLDL